MQTQNSTQNPHPASSLNNQTSVNKENLLSIESSRSNAEQSFGCKFTTENKKFSRHLLCKICSQLMIDPVRLYPCGHTFCRYCIIDHNKKHSPNPANIQSKCFVPFPECGKYFMNLQPDLMASGLIDDLEVKCLSIDCPWTGPLERFKISHRQYCKLKEGGLNKWLQSLNQDIQKIEKGRKQRKSKPCIDIDIDVQERTQIKGNLEATNSTKESKEGQNLIIASTELTSKDQSNKEVSIVDDDVCDITEVPSEGKLLKKEKSRQSILNLTDVHIDQRIIRQNISNPNQKPSKKDLLQSKKASKLLTPIILDEESDTNPFPATGINQEKQDTNQEKQGKAPGQNQIQRKYTGLKMINSYKNRSNKIAQNPHDMSLTRSQPLRIHQNQSQLLDNQ